MIVDIDKVGSALVNDKNSAGLLDETHCDLSRISSDIRHGVSAQAV